MADTRYASLDRLPGATGSDAQNGIARLKARLIARYGLISDPRKPEELVSGEGRRISIGYGCGTIRIRQHEGREWTATLDIQTASTFGQVYEFLDPYFGFLDGKAPRH